MIVTLLALAALVCAYGYFHHSRRRLYALAQQVPDSLPSLPLIGHLHHFIGDNISICKKVLLIAEHTNKHQGISKIWLGPVLIYTLTDPEDVATALNYCIEKNIFFRFMKSWIGNGLVSSEASIWKYRHKKLQPAFNQRILNGFIPIFNKQSSVLVRALAHKGEQIWFNPQGLIEIATLEMICQTAMGIPEDKKNIVDLSYLAAIHKMEKLITLRSCRMWLYPDCMYNLSSFKKEENDLLKVLKNVSNTVIKTRRAEYEEKSKHNLQNSDDKKEHRFRPFLDLLLELSKEDDVFTDEAIREEVDTMIVAGQETTAYSTNFALLLLGSHQDKQEKAYDEIRSVFGDSDREVTKEDLSKLVYLEAVVNESLRLYPIVPFIIRKVVEELKLKNCTLAKGSTISVSLWGMHRHERWGADYNSFRPERWFDSVCMANTQGSFCAFSAGKRVCIGKTYAMMSVKTMLVHVLRNFRIHSDIKQLILTIEITLKHCDGNLIKLEKR